MNHRLFALAFLLSLTAPVCASAASVVMVQFGSFETMAEAQKRLSEVKASHGATLGNLPITVREVKLPPDNLTVYRTQAGPLDTRTSAQALCSKLANSGDECYVVETAMAGTVTPVVAAATPAPVTQPAPVTTALASPSALDARGPALTSIDNSAEPETLPAASRMPSPDMQAALDRAAAAQNAPATSPKSISAPAAAPRTSFWSRMNPFSDSTSAEPANSMLKPDFQPATEVVSAPVSPMLAAPVAAPVIASNASLLAPAAQQPYESLPLLPPPPPLTARDKEFLERNMSASTPEVIASSIPTTPVIAAPTPIASAPLPATGYVRVEEAKRVPLTQTNQTAITTVQPTPTVSLLPSSTLGQKTLWAQIGQFNDAQAALTFWENYRRMHPDFPVVRVRVTAAIAQQRHGNDRVSLRVGPFARAGFIRNLCASMDPESKLRCGFVTDAGVAGNANPAPGYLNGSRYKR